jgi:hypothetical protein
MLETLKCSAPILTAALLLALLAATPSAVADKVYSHCDPFASRFCRRLVALYEFKEGSDYARTSETGSAPFLEPDRLHNAATRGSSGVRARPDGLMLLHREHAFVPSRHQVAVSGGVSQ